MNLDRVLYRFENILHEALGGEIIVINLDSMKTVALDEHGLLVWNLFDGARNIDSVIKILCEVYPDQSEEIKSDVVSAVESLEGNGLLLEDHR